ncbi:anti-sigma factor family protein [Ramlibacter rhizophilus]|uniref:Anti-sigma factor n=1 Tax=Ramlibacter rhizophilus TaxID=1781167 RepID=A0A4Z0C391_9BURK|nr:anti-sigma factor [Ramlibacter rhizophilus]TFZ04940.1 anti-sigma factor [Ramlibacter rhizophilus]
MNPPSSAPPPPGDDELHAYVDGRLAPDEAARVQARLETDAAAAQAVAAWRSQREALRAHLSEALQDPLPPHLLAAADTAQRRAGQSRRARGWGGMAAASLLAFSVGWLGHAQWQATRGSASSASPGGFARQALVAHAVYAPEQRHPVEVGAAEQEHLVQWLSRRLGRPLRLPQLNAEGFELVGGRLLPGETGARAQFMYQGPSGERLTLYMGAAPAGAGQALEFRFLEGEGTSSFYWVDRGFAYALTGPLPRPRLMELARLTHRALQP